MKKSPESSLSVVIPCFNEEDTIEIILKKILKEKIVKQIIVVDDGSTDQSWTIIERVKKWDKTKRIESHRQEKNKGKGAAVALGFKFAKGAIVVIQDADLEYDPTDYKRLINPIVEGKADAVFGSRFLTASERRVIYYWHSVGNKILTTISNIFTNINLTDMETCYKAISQEFAMKLKLTEPRFGLEPEITAKLSKMDARIYEVSISYNGRTYKEGKKITWKDGFSAIRCIIKYNLFPKL